MTTASKLSGGVTHPQLAFRKWAWRIAAWLAGLLTGVSPALLGGGDFWLCYLPPVLSFVLGFAFGRSFGISILGIYLGLLITAAIPSQEQIIRLDSWQMVPFFLFVNAVLISFSVATGLLGCLVRWAVNRNLSVRQ